MAEHGNGLSERKKQILKAIVEAHIELGEPVGSKYLMSNKQIACSSATIRNEMAELEMLGYLEQPHTSAGRVPSELGYRFYVDTLAEHYSMTAREITEINRLLKTKVAELDQLLVAASKLASSLTNYTGIAVTPRKQSVSISRFETVYMDAYNFLLVMIISSSDVKTKYITVEQELDPATVKHIGEALNYHLVGLCANEITLAKLMELEGSINIAQEVINVIMKAIYTTMTEIDGGDVKFSGVNRLLDYPEFSTKEKLSDILGAIENNDEILDLISYANDDDVSVLIGSECSVRVMDRSALVFKPIKIDGNVVGAIGIIGPVRMDYSKAVATIESLGSNIGDIFGSKKKLLKGGNQIDDGN